MATAIRRVYENVQFSRTMIRDLNRFRQIITVLVRHGLGAVVEQMNLGESWVRHILRTERTAESSLSIPVRVLRAIQDLGPTFVKLGQILSTRPDLVPPEYIEQLKTLQDRVPPFPFDQVKAQIEAELDKPLEELFARFDEKPLASASMAQVHRAQLKTGEEVVVKIQRPGIAPQIECDVEILGFLARQLEANFPETQMFSPVGIVKEFEKAILKELDFETERDHLERFRRSFAEVEGVAFPKPYVEYSTKRVLVMEFIDGVKITEVVDNSVFDVEKIVKTGFAVIFKMIYEDGFFHADLHPGNLFVRGDSELCLIDCGLVGTLTPKQKDYLSTMLLHLARQDFHGICRVFWEMAIHNKPSEYFDTFEADIAPMLQKWFAGKNLSEIEFGGVFKDLVDGALRHEMIMPADYTMTFKALVTMEGIAKQLCPDVDLIQEAQPFVTKIVMERFSPRRLLADFLEGARTFTQAVRFLPERMNSALSELTQGRIRMEVELGRIQQLQRSYQKAQNRNQLAILEAALLLCGTLMIDHREFELFGLPGLTVVFYSLAVVFGLGHLLGILRSGGT